MQDSDLGSGLGDGGILEAGAAGAWVQNFTNAFAASIYLNSAPLVHSFLSRPGSHTFLGDTAGQMRPATRLRPM